MLKRGSQIAPVEQKHELRSFDILMLETIESMMGRNEGFFYRRKLIQCLRNFDDFYPFGQNVDLTSRLFKKALNLYNNTPSKKLHTNTSEIVIHYFITYARHATPEYSSTLIQDMWLTHSAGFLVRLFQQTHYEKVKSGIFEALKDSAVPEHGECYFVCVQQLVSQFSRLKVPRTDGSYLNTFLRAALYRAVLKNRASEAMMLINAGADRFSTCPFEEGYVDKTLLQVCVIRQKAELLEHLLKGGIEPDFKDKYGRSALQTACELGYLKMADILLRYHATAMLADNNQMLPLQRVKPSKRKAFEKLFLSHQNKGIAQETPVATDSLAAVPTYIPSLALDVPQGRTEMQSDEPLKMVSTLSDLPVLKL